MKKLFFKKLFVLLLVSCFFFAECNVVSSYADETSIVQTASLYTYGEMCKDLAELSVAYPEYITLSSMGVSTLGLNIPVVVLGNPAAPKRVLVTSTMHACEFLATQACMKLIEYYASEYSKGGMQDVYITTCFYIIPMVNPDGVTVSQAGGDWIPDESIKAFVKGQGHYSKWKSNAVGIDLNRNFDAMWDRVNLQGFNAPSYRFWKGYQPEEAIECKELVAFAKSLPFDVFLNFHQQGNVIYNGSKLGTPYTNARSLNLAQILSSVNGYAVDKDPKVITPSSSFGTWADYVLLTFDKPSVTLEMGNALYPSGQKQVDSIVKRNKQVFRMVSAFLCAQ